MARIFKVLLIITLLSGLAAGAGGAMLILQNQPALEATPPPTPQDVAATRQLIRDIRRVTAPDVEEMPLLRTDEAQLNSAIRLGARFVPGFRGRVTVAAGDMLVEAAVPVPWWRGQKWLNISGRVPEFEGQIVLGEISVGGMQVPPALALRLTRLGGNLVIGDGFGDTVMNAATAMKIVEGDPVFRIALDNVGKNGVMRGAFGSLRGAQMPTPDTIETYHLLIRAAMEEGRLKPTGSFLPYLQFTLEAALARSTPETLRDAYTAAVFGLAKTCGAQDFAMIVGRLAFDATAGRQEWTTSCSEVTSNGRVDSRRHFITAAALQAASNTGVAVSIGEFKELYDSISGAGGFDFTDMAANLSGIRLSDVLMTTDYSVWPDMLSRLQKESDMIISFDGIPQIMTKTEFEARFTGLDSAAYMAMLTLIETKIDQLSLYQPL